MSAKDRKIAEAAFGKKQKREAELNEVLKQEDARRAAAMKNMQRLRALRIERDAKNHRAKKRACSPIGALGTPAACLFPTRRCLAV